MIDIREADCRLGYHFQYKGLDVDTTRTGSLWFGTPA